MEKYYVTVSKIGDTRWFKDAKLRILHRIGGPAFEWLAGDKFWYLNGKLHREDGPAVNWVDGSKEWWVNGKQITEAEFNARTQPPCTDKVITIDGVNYKLTKI